MPPLISAGRDLMSSGLHPAVHPLDAPLWVDGRNIAFGPWGVRKAPGWTVMHGAPVSVSGVTRAAVTRSPTAGNRRVVVFGESSKLWRVTDTGGPVVVGSGYAPGRWSFCEWGDWMLASNSLNSLQVWRGEGAFAALDLDWRARHLIRRGPHVLAIGCDDAWQRVRWSAQADPETWDPLVNDSSGWIDIREAQGPIHDVVAWGDSIAVLTAHQVFFLDYAGYPTGFVYRAGPRIGAVGPGTTVTHGGMLYGWHSDGPWMTDGVSVRALDDPIRSWWRDLSPPDPGADPWTGSWSTASACLDAEAGLILWTLPSRALNGAPLMTLAFDLARQTWSALDLAPAAWVTERGVYARPLAVMGDGRVIESGVGHDAGGEVMTAWLRSKPLTGDDTTVALHITSALAHLARVRGGIELRLGGSRYADDPPTWGPWRPAGESATRLPLRADGRFVTLELRCTGLDAHFELGGLAAYGHTGGRR